MIYKGRIEFEFESNQSLEALENMLQVCLIEKDANENISKITLDNIFSEEFAVTEYHDLEVSELCEDCNESKEFRVISIDENNVSDGLVCVNYKKCKSAGLK